MRYLKKYNEELKSDTYKSAADKLARMGHVKRPEELMKWHDIAKEKEEIAKEEARLKAIEESKRKVLEQASKLGIHKLTLKDRSTKFTGDFYINFNWDSDNFYEYYGDWKNNDNSGFWLTFYFSVIPASDESKEFANEVLSKEMGIPSDGRYSLGHFGINLSEGGNGYDDDGKQTLILKPSGGYYEEEWYNIDWDMADRASAQKFKKMLYDVFEGNIVWRETPELPGGVKEQILDFLCSDMDHTLEEFEEFIESLKRISVNKIYKD